MRESTYRVSLSYSYYHIIRVNWISMYTVRGVLYECQNTNQIKSFINFWQPRGWISNST